MHGRPLHGFRNRLRIAVVVLVTLEERLHVLRRDQTHIVLQLPADVMGTRTRLHADQAARNIGQTAFELTTGYLLLQDDCTPPAMRWNVLLPRSIPIVVMIPAVF
jgi:hypothetical protein